MGKRSQFVVACRRCAVDLLPKTASTESGRVPQTGLERELAYRGLSASFD